MTPQEPSLGGATTASAGTAFPVDLARDRRARRTWVGFIGGPVIWITHFMLVYLVAEAGCTGDGPGLEVFDPPVPRTVTLALTAVAAAACVALAAWDLRRWRSTRRGAVGDVDVQAGLVGDGGGRGGLAFVGFLLSSFSFVAILFVGLPRGLPAGVLMSALAHAGQPPAPHDIWGAWNLDPLLVLGLVLAVVVHRRGRGDRRRATYFVVAMTTLGVALVSPLDAMSGALASAHMVQHMLLVLVAAPLLALSAPSRALMRGGPAIVRRAAVRWRRRLDLDRSSLRLLRDPIAAGVLHAAALWFWHAAVPYDAGLRSHALHVLEHATFVVTGVLFWRVVLGSRAAGRVSNGLGVLLVFAMAMQSVILAMLLTFAPTPWYSGYATTTRLWHLEPLTDQQLAGVVMWVPAGVVYVGVALVLLVAWIEARDEGQVTRTTRLPPMPERTNRS